MTDFIGGNHLQLLRNGAEYFPALEKAIAQARDFIFIQTYIYAQDSVGVSIGNALMAAASRGVATHLLVDGFGSKELAPVFVAKLEEAGVQVMFYRPKISPWTFKKNRLRRLHHKIAVIDGKVGFVGGINIIDDFDVPNHAPNNVPPRIDYAVRIEGKLLPIISSSAQKLWRRMAWLRMRKEKALGAPTIMPHTQTPIKSKKGGIQAAFVLRDNVLHRRDIEDAYLTAINNAKDEIIIANAYFVPGRKFRKALLAAAARSVRVQLLLQGRLEYFLMFATHAFYGEFLKNGIEIFEYRKSFMHSKVAVIDGFWATVGSSNIDPFSLLLAREANIVVQDASFASELRTDVLATIQTGGMPILPKAWAHGNKFKRFASWIAFGLVRGFLGLIGHSNK